MIWNLVNPVSLLPLGLAEEGVGAPPVLLVMGVLAALIVVSIALLHRPVLGLDPDQHDLVSDQRQVAQLVPTKPSGPD